jgi:predicted regulator of amino acid metabolism with ACT domain
MINSSKLRFFDKNIDDSLPVIALLHPFINEQESNDLLIEFRNEVVNEIEKVRQLKKIGKALDCGIIIRGSNKVWIYAYLHQEYLKELLNVSQLSLVYDTSTYDKNIIEVVILKENGMVKCERCYHYSYSLCIDNLCNKCVAIITKHFKDTEQSIKIVQHLNDRGLSIEDNPQWNNV